MKVLIGLFIWVELINFSFNLMTEPNTLYFFGGFLLLALIIIGPIIYYGDNIVMFLKNMKGVFSDEEEIEKKDEKLDGILCTMIDEHKKLEVFHDLKINANLGGYRDVLRNLVDYEAGKTIFQTALGIIERSNVKQNSLFGDGW
jgi:hypothetical protein